MRVPSHCNGSKVARLPAVGPDAFGCSATQSWRGAPTQLAYGEVHVWQLCFSSTGLAKQGWQVMTDEERKRAESFRFMPDRERYCQSRLLLRSVLGGYLRQYPDKVPVVVGQHGKPQLDAAISSHDLQFNLSHSRDVAMLAVTTGQPVGIDVEAIASCSNLDVSTLVEGLLSDREAEAIKAQARESGQRSFLRCWTRKEALLKAVGLGLLTKLNEFEVPIDDLERWSVQWRPNHRSPPSTFQMADLSDGDYAAAVAAPVILGPVRQFEFRHRGFTECSDNGNPIS
ncbi:4'-phosphopantetheinyl transferase superfamily protein [Bradyrhizobium sp. CIAT3101]|uniref:4'-phosphopantetheinyl transferase family protein n=1 Tax=Bradyrhizobium sp. CIAT3101 TaxID=439387 RepID=UPI0024B1FE5A|nr:4'-phosphopantetheinyl transferase superfamily protein [Bradyrhizobium sp. CIAT3101]WFU79144.1 4'-phosphopantetheinyl transferase superfamily protein [Bradyrhizobium sp. CIAT3101]